MPVYEGTSEQILMLLSLYNDIVITLLLQINYCWKTIDTAFKSKKKKKIQNPPLITGLCIYNCSICKMLLLSVLETVQIPTLSWSLKAKEEWWVLLTCYYVKSPIYRISRMRASSHRAKNKLTRCLKSCMTGIISFSILPDSKLPGKDREPIMDLLKCLWKTNKSQ